MAPPALHAKPKPLLISSAFPGSCGARSGSVLSSIALSGDDVFGGGAIEVVISIDETPPILIEVDERSLNYGDKQSHRTLLAMALLLCKDFL
jgi:hypothetical protein